MLSNLHADGGADATRAHACGARDAQYECRSHCAPFAATQGLLRLRRDTQASVHSRGSDVWRAILG